MSHSFRGGESERIGGIELRRSVDAVWRQAAADPLLTGAIASMGIALGLRLAGHSRAARFVGLWAPTLLLIDLYRRTNSLSNASESRRRAVADVEFERRFEGGCASPPTEWEESVDPGFRMTAARDPDDYSERISRVAPLKAR